MNHEDTKTQRTKGWQRQGMVAVNPFLRSLCLCVFVVYSLGACSFGRLAPGPTKEGVAVAVAASSPDEARRRALSSIAELYAAAGSPAAAKVSELIAARSTEFVGRARLKAGKGVVEIKMNPLAHALGGLLRPPGFSAKEPRVLILISEPVAFLDVGVGPASDALRRGLSAYGLTAADGRDALNGFSAKGKDAAALTATAARLGFDWLLIGAAAAQSARDPQSGVWQASATLVLDEYEVLRSTPVERNRFDASVVDVSSAAAVAKALDQAGETASARIAATISRAAGGRSEAAVFVTGSYDVPRFKVLLSSLRQTEGVAAAFLGAWSAEEGVAVVRVFLEGIKTDGLAARLLRREPTLTLLSIEPGSGRLAVDIPERRDN